LFSSRALFATTLLAIACLHLKLNASFDKMLPKQQQYIVNYLQHERDLKGFGNAIRIAVETGDGTIFTKDYLDTLRRLTTRCSCCLVSTDLP